MYLNMQHILMMNLKIPLIDLIAAALYSSSRCNAGTKLLSITNSDSD